MADLQRVGTGHALKCGRILHIPHIKIFIFILVPLWEGSVKLIDLSSVLLDLRMVLQNIE